MVGKMKKYINLIFILASFCCVSTSNANPVDASEWLVAQQNKQGSFGSDSDIANLDQSTQETVLALAVGFEQETANAVNYLLTINLEIASTEQISRRILAKQAANLDDSLEVQELLLRRSERSAGFGEY